METKETRVLGFDPAKKNFGYGFKVNGVVVESGLVPTPNNVTNGIEDDIDFLNFIIDLLQRLKPTEVVCERYMFRGRASVDAESVNWMIGKLSILVRQQCGFNINLVMPVQWKLWYKSKIGKLKKDKFKSKEIYPEINTEHEADALCMTDWLVANKKD